MVVEPFNGFFDRVGDGGFVFVRQFAAELLLVSDLVFKGVRVAFELVFGLDALFNLRISKNQLQIQFRTMIAIENMAK